MESCIRHPIRANFQLQKFPQKFFFHSLFFHFIRPRCRVNYSRGFKAGRQIILIFHSPIPFHVQHSGPSVRLSARFTQRVYIPGSQAEMYRVVNKFAVYAVKGYRRRSIALLRQIVATCIPAIRRAIHIDSTFREQRTGAGYYRSSSI